jgi:hypothetical protein
MFASTKDGGLSKENSVGFRRTATRYIITLKRTSPAGRVIVREFPSLQVLSDTGIRIPFACATTVILPQDVS